MAILFESDLQLPRNPQENLHAATKQYVDAGLATKADTVHTHTVTQLVGLGSAALCDTGVATGNVPTIGPNGKLNPSVLPSITTNSTFVVANEAAMLALTAQRGDVAVRTDVHKSFILIDTPSSTLSNWQELLTPTSAVDSVNGKVGSVVLVAADVGAIAVTEKGVANGVATLDAAVKVPIAQLPAYAAITNDASVVPTGAAVYEHTSATDVHGATTTPTVGRIVQWDGNLRLKSNDPAAADDVATKRYVDGALGGGAWQGTVTGDGASTELAVTHDLDSMEVRVDVYKNGTTPVQVQWLPTSSNRVTLYFAVPPATTDRYRVQVRS